MAETIKDGAGSGTEAKVNENQRLYTSSITVDEDQSATKDGRSFNINTGVITLTDSAETPILYVKNNEDVPLHVTAIAVGIGPNTDGSGSIPVIRIKRNPSSGTIISSPTDADIVSNRNFSSSKTLTVDAYKGATSKTMTGGSDHIIFFQGANGRLFASIDEVLDKGATIGITIDLQPNNTNQIIYGALICHLEDPKD
jgi:hypothetical protein